MVIEVGKVLSFRPTDYDARVLSMIAESHPEIPDVGDLIRKALREYEKAVQGGGMRVQVREMWEIATGRRSPYHAEYDRAKVAECDGLGDAQ